MCKATYSTGFRSASLLASVIFGLMALLTPVQTARAQNCVIGLADGPGVPDESFVHVGDTVHFFIHLNAEDAVCLLVGGTNWVIIPDGTVHQILGPYTKANCGVGS